MIVYKVIIVLSVVLSAPFSGYQFGILWGIEECIDKITKNNKVLENHKITEENLEESVELLQYTKKLTDRCLNYVD